MLVIELTYIKPLEEVNKFLEEHRSFLDKYYSEGVFLASGAKVPRNGGIILAVADRVQIERILPEDPFHQQGIANYTITEFTPNKFCDALKPILDGIDSSATK